MNKLLQMKDLRIPLEVTDSIYLESVNSTVLSEEQTFERSGVIRIYQLFLSRLHSFSTLIHVHEVGLVHFLNIIH